jgi:hypothetical protein
MYSRRHSMQGGLTGHGYHSLGGLLLGGVKKADMTERQLQLYEASLLRQKAKRLANRQAMEAKGTPLRTKGVISPRGLGRNAHLHNMLKRLIDAETMGANMERADHPDLARYLDEDVMYNQALYDSNRYPKFYTDKFSKKHYGMNNYSDLFPAAAQRAAMSEERKAQLRQGKEAARGQAKFLYLDSRGNRKTLTYGTKAYQAAASTKRVQEDPSLLQQVA